jgi:hypothetical protein
MQPSAQQTTNNPNNLYFIGKNLSLMLPVRNVSTGWLDLVGHPLAAAVG